MLILSRKQNEAVFIGNLVTVYVVEIRGDKVRLGFDAPPEVAIHRQEVYLAIHRANQEAAAKTSTPLAAGEKTEVPQ